MTKSDIIALGFFLFSWSAYTLYAKRRAKNINCLARQMRAKRTLWMQTMLTRDNRMADVAILAAIERNITFFASSSMLILAGLVTAVASADSLTDVLQQLFGQPPVSKASVQFKLLFLAAIYVFAFFQFTWSIRQNGFALVLVGAAPAAGSLDEQSSRQLAERIAKIIDLAGHSFNYGLRATYFSLAGLCWFVSPKLLIVATLAVIGVLYHREFHSKPLKALDW